MAGKRVLIVEDNLDSRHLYERALRMEGFEVSGQCASGKEALNAIGSMIPPELALVDLTLPDMSGGDVVTRMKREPSWSRTKVIVVSGRDNLRERVADLQADGHVAKPFDLDSFYREIHRCVD